MLNFSSYNQEHPSEIKAKSVKQIMESEHQSRSKPIFLL